METVSEIQSAIEELGALELSRLAWWFDAHLENVWDARMEADARAGRFQQFKSQIEIARGKNELVDFP